MSHSIQLSSTSSPLRPSGQLPELLLPDASPKLAGCPGLFCPTQAQDAIITRLRTPGGQVHRSQLKTLLSVLESLQTIELLITNRANLQWRSQRALQAHELGILQSAGLAAHPEIDHLRNVLASPIAGCGHAIANTEPIVQQLNQWLSQAKHLKNLSAKFSIGLEGGEALSVRDRLNDIWLVAESARQFRLWLSLSDSEEVRTPWVTEDCVGLVAAIAQVYLTESDRLLVKRAAEQAFNASIHPSAKPISNRRSQKPRLKDILRSMPIDRFLEQCQEQYQASVLANSQTLSQLTDFGSEILAETQFLEITLPLGYLTLVQLRSLMDCLDQFNLSEIRLTPWQSLIIPGIAIDRISDLTAALIQANLDPNPNHPAKGIVACSGKSGCASAATHAKEHAIQLIQTLQSQTSNSSSNPSIHFSGCDKRCAQKKDGAITLIGIERADPNGDRQEVYELWLHGQKQNTPFSPEEAIAWLSQQRSQTQQLNHPNPNHLIPNHQIPNQPIDPEDILHA